MIHAATTNKTPQLPNQQLGVFGLLSEKGFVVAAECYGEITA